MDLDLSTLNDEQRTALLPIFNAFNAEITSLQNQLKDAAGGDQSEKITALETRLAEMQTKLDAATSAKPDGKGADKKKTDDEPQGTAAELKAELESIKETLAGFTSERENQNKAQTAQQLAAKVVAEKYPNASEGQKKILVKRIALANPADEAAAIAAGKSTVEELTEAGITIKGIGSDASAEGKKKAAEPGSEEAQIEEIRKRPRSGSLI